MARSMKQVLLGAGLFVLTFFLLLYHTSYLSITSSEPQGGQGSAGSRVFKQDLLGIHSRDAEGHLSPFISTTTTTTSIPAHRRLVNVQNDRYKSKALSELSDLPYKDLELAKKMLGASKDPSKVPAHVIEHALSVIKVKLLEEVTNRNFSDALAAAHLALPIANITRPPHAQVVIATTWRSGSTFLEELLASHPAVFNHYEPLTQFGLKRIREDSDAYEAIRVIRNLLGCRYEHLDNYLNTAKKLTEMISRNRLVWQTCHHDKWSDALCFNKKFLREACLLAPWSTMKVVRMRVKFFRSVLEEDLDVRLLYLVRDPRGVFNSRRSSVKWCKTPDCNDPSGICQDMHEDFHAALQLRKDFPGRVYILRYEDLALNPSNKTASLLDHLGFDFDPKMKSFLASHTTKNFDKPWSTTRESATRVTYWASKLPIGVVSDIQKVCKDAMAELGYRSVNSTNNITVDSVLEPLVLV
ncbi:carbohydrate sulfotransferase 1-like isoform X2 [Oratosquilla oratoria]|uniref:carbohydrate sulfotransferase 1-like isoform X2 n=1 Tax=Oratosquilla oratoria TaxID=337810 RepID=UPI003F766995